MLMQGYNNEDIASGIDEHMFRQPLGVVTAITPFNFPGMIPLWFLPYAVASGNCFILKPSERVPVTARKMFELIERAGFPMGTRIDGKTVLWPRVAAALLDALRRQIEGPLPQAAGLEAVGGRLERADVVEPGTMRLPARAAN